MVRENRKAVFEKDGKEEESFADYRIEPEFYTRLIRQYHKKTVDKVIYCVQRLERKVASQMNDYTFCMAVEVQNSSRIVNKKFLLEEEICIQDVTEDMIEYISSIVGKNFKEDMLLKTSVALFLNSSLVRVKFGFEIHNPFLEEIKHRYPAIFSACFTSSQVYEKLIGAFPSEDEISYMAVLFEGAMEAKKRNINTVVVGSGGMGIGQIIARKIEDHIPEINVTSVLPANSAVMIEEETMSKEEILKKGCELLYEKGYVKQGFYEDALKREKISASVLGGGVALPHGMANLVIKPAVVVIKCAQRTEWQDGCVDIVFLLALNFEDIKSTRAFFSSFYEMTMEKNTALMIRKAETKEEIMNVIMNSLYETE